MYTIESALSPKYFQTPFLNQYIIEPQLAPVWAPEIVDIDFINQILQSDIYKKLTLRKYRPIKGYANWLNLMKLFAEILNNNKIIYKKNELLSLQKLHIINNFVNQQGNSYWVDENFFRIIKNLSKPRELPKSFPCGLLLFPSHLCPCDRFGHPVDWVVFQYVKDKKIMPCDIRYDQKNSKLLSGESIVWATCTQNQIFTGAILAQNLSNAVVIRNKQPFVEEVEATSLAIGNLLLHSLNAGANPERKLIKAKGFTKNQQHKAIEEEPIYLNPKWIGREVKVYSRETARGTHRSPITHQRKEYTRQQRCGKGLQEIRSVNVRATVVNKHQEDK